MSKPPTPSPRELPILSMLRPVLVQIAPAVYRPLYPFAAILPGPDSRLHVDGWLHCHPQDAFNRWIKDGNSPQMPGRMHPFVWVENVPQGDRVGEFTDSARVGEIEILTATLKELTGGSHG